MNNHESNNGIASLGWINATGIVLAREGWKGLTEAAVAAEMGLPVAAIKDHFNDFGDLLDTYVRGKNPWPRLVSDGIEAIDHTAASIRAAFISIPQTYMELLATDRELNGLTAAQLQKPRESVLAIIESREEWVERLFESAAPFLGERLEEFRVMVAIVLAGTEGIFAGPDELRDRLGSIGLTIDINDAEERESLLQTQEFLIGNAWDDACI